MTGASERSTERTGTATASPGPTSSRRRPTLDELHGSLDAAWQAVNEVVRLVEELHRRRGHGRLR